MVYQSPAQTYFYQKDIVGGEEPVVSYDIPKRMEETNPAEI